MLEITLTLGDIIQSAGKKLNRIDVAGTFLKRKIESSVQIYAISVGLRPTNKRNLRCKSLRY